MNDSNMDTDGTGPMEVEVDIVDRSNGGDARSVSNGTGPSEAAANLYGYQDAGNTLNQEHAAYNRRRSMSGEEERSRRASIKAILADESITPAERRRSIQYLMDGRRSSIGASSVASSNNSYSTPVPSEIEDVAYGYSYSPHAPDGSGRPQSNVYYSEHPSFPYEGDQCVPIANETTKRAEQTRPHCNHYERRCTMVAPCCGAAFGCRICHDDSPVLPPLLMVKQARNRYPRSSSMPGSFTTANMQGANPGAQSQDDTHHNIDRFAVKEIICRECYTKQSAKTNNCVNCGVQFGTYHCNVCNLWMSNDEKPYHCEDCGFCRVGGAENFQHCHDCGMCIDKSLYSNHNCKSGKYKSNCLAEDMQVLTSHGFLGYEDLRPYFLSDGTAIASKRIADGSLLVAGYDPETDRLVYETPTLFIDNSPGADDVYEITNDAYGQSTLAPRWSGGMSLHLTGGHQVFVRFGEYLNRASAFAPGHSHHTGHNHKCAQPADQSNRTLVFKKPDGPSFLPSFSKVRVVDILLRPTQRIGTDGNTYEAGMQLLAAATNGIVSQHPDGIERLSSLTGLNLYANETLGAFLEMIGFWLCNGSVEIGSDSFVGIYQLKPHNISWLEQTCHNLGLGPSDFRSQDMSNGENSSFVINKPDVVRFFQRSFGPDFGDSTVPDHTGISVLESDKHLPSWLFDLGRDEVRLVIAGYLRANGDLSGHDDVLYASTAHFRDGLVRLALHAGYSASVTRRSSRSGNAEDVSPESVKPSIYGWAVRVGSKSHLTHPNVPLAHIKRVEYTGRTWCLNMPSGYLITRRVQKDADGVVLHASNPIVIGNCPVCQEFLFSSRSASHEMPCGHAIHWECFRQLAAHDSRCPVCKKTAETRDRMLPTWSAMAAGVAMQTVPPELARVVNITCNDCEKSDDARAWHFLGVQCRSCSSFNTVVDRIIMSGEEAHEFLETLQTRSDLTENEDGSQRISRRRINRRRSLF